MASDQCTPGLCGRREGGSQGSRGGWAREPGPTATNTDGLRKLGSQHLAQAIPRQLLPGRPPSGPHWREGSGYSPCRERSSKGARGEPREVMPGPQGARPPPARLLFAAAEARAGRSALPGQPVRPTRRPAAVRPAGLRPSGAHTRQVQLPRRPAPRRLSSDQARPVLAGLAPQSQSHLALPQDQPAPRAAGGATPPYSRPATPAAAWLRSAPRRPLALLGLPGNRGSSATPGGPPAERARRAAGAAPATCAPCGPLHRTPPGVPGPGPGPGGPVLPARPEPLPAQVWGQSRSPESSRRDFSTSFLRASEILSVAVLK